MAKKMTQQRYYAAAQDTVNGKLRLTLLEEGKDTSGCQALMKSEDFAKKYQEFVADNMAFRVAIIREEPAVRIITEPSPLAKELAGQIGDMAILRMVMDTLAKHGQATGGQLVFKEDSTLPASTIQKTQEGAQEAQGSETGTFEATLPPTPPAPPAKPTVDVAGKVPLGWQDLSLPELLAVAKGVNPTVNDNFTKTACTAAISKYLENPRPTQILDMETKGLVQPPSAPPMSQFNLGKPAVGLQPPATEPEEGGSSDAANIPPNTEVYWVQEECPGCQCLVWRYTTNETRKEAVAGYPEHSCPWYTGLKSRMQGPPPPPSAPPMVQPPSPPAPPAPPAPPTEGMVRPPVSSGQAPLFGRGFGVPPLPPAPPKI